MVVNKPIYNFYFRQKHLVVGENVFVRQEQHAPEEVEKNRKLEQVQDTIDWSVVVVLWQTIESQDQPLVDPEH